MHGSDIGDMQRAYNDILFCTNAGLLLCLCYIDRLNTSGVHKLELR